MSDDHESIATAPFMGEGAAREPADDQSPGKLTTRWSGRAMFECSSLSPRECGILQLIGQGYSNKRVARALGITAETVKSHVKRVFLKLEVNTRAHAVARAQRLGLFGLEFARSATSAGDVGDSQD